MKPEDVERIYRAVRMQDELGAWCDQETSTQTAFREALLVVQRETVAMCKERARVITVRGTSHSAYEGFSDVIDWSAVDAMVKR